MKNHRIDVIGDVHGHLGALRNLGRSLGYDVDAGWSHPDGRVLIFLGDVVDRGPDSLAVGQLVQSLVAEHRAHCLMGNHEYNLLDWWFLSDPPKVRRSNKQTIADINARKTEWEPVLDFFTTLPLAIELPEIRIIHAGWHTQSVEALASLLGRKRSPASDADTWDWVADHVALGSPFEGKRLRPTLPHWGVDGSHDTMHEVLIKGLESAEHGPVIDAEGTKRRLARVRWWLGEAPDVDTSKATVFGHYWSLPPVREDIPLAPPFPVATRDHRDWQVRNGRDPRETGERQLGQDDRFVCIDHNGTIEGCGRGCVGAYRWPEHRVAWAMQPQLIAEVK